MPTIYADFGRRVGAMCEGLGISPGELAGKAGVHEAVISKIIAGQHRPDNALVDAICIQLSTTRGALFFGISPERLEKTIVNNAIYALMNGLKLSKKHEEKIAEMLGLSGSDGIFGHNSECESSYSDTAGIGEPTEKPLNRT